MKITLDGKALEVKSGTIEDALDETGINPETVIVKKNGVLVPNDERIAEGDSLETIVVISSG